MPPDLQGYGITVPPQTGLHHRHVSVSVSDFLTFFDLRNEKSWTMLPSEAILGNR